VPAMPSQRSRQRRRAPDRAPADRPARNRPEHASRVPAIAGSILLVAVVALVAYVRLRLADLPLERDEGEYAYAGQLILKGIPPYELAYNMKFPGTYYAYAAIMAIFGQTAWGIRMGLLCVQLATMALVYVLGRRVAGATAATTGTAAFGLLAIDRWSMGVFAHATHFVTLPAVAGLLVLHRGMSSGRPRSFVVAGVLMGVAIIMKQHAAAFAVMAAGLAAWSARHSGWREQLRLSGLVVAGVAMSLATLVAVLAAEGVLGRYWFWTYEYAAAYVSQIPLWAADDMFWLSWTYITQADAVLWYSGLAGLILLFVTRWETETRVVLLAWVAAAALAVLPGFFFRQHYFIVLMPAAGLLVGVAAAAAARLLGRALSPSAASLSALALFTVAAGVYVQREARYMFQMTPTEVMRSVYSVNPFLEAPEIARYIKNHSGPDDRIVVLGSEPEIFFYADRKSATGYIYTYPLMEDQPYAARMQDEFRREVEAARPLYLVYVGVPTSWGARPESNPGVLNWATEFTARCYERVGLIDIDPTSEARIRWDTDSRTYQPRFPSQVWTYRRTDKPSCRGPG
jgi:4-amino-4-deoxy-L-arabinose transferase-like glycosyltransferase